MQEVCLQVFGGHHLSGELEGLSRGFRDDAGIALPPSPRPLATVPAPAHAARTVPGLRAGSPAAEPSTEPHGRGGSTRVGRGGRAR